MRLKKQKILLGVLMLSPIVAGIQTASAVPLPGGTLDPLTIPKYVTPLVIPPVMNNAGTNAKGVVYDIAVRQFQQQILPGGIWAGLPGCAAGACTFPATTVWSYGPDADPTPVVAPAVNSQFNYPAYTIENVRDGHVTVNWINDLVDANGDALPHLFAVDQSLHWANPAADCLGGELRTDCMGTTAAPYTGPVPMVSHVHGAHVGASGDGYTEAWWLPNANNITCVDRDPVTGVPVSIPTGLTQVTNPDGTVSDSWNVVCEGTIANQLTNANGVVVDNTNNPLKAGQGAAKFGYPNDQPSSTLWYHDHSLGMTRLNVMAGPAGFWLVRDLAGVGGETGLNVGMVLPGPAPIAGDTVLELNAPGLMPGTLDKRSGIREIPIVIQGRSFDWVDANGIPTIDPALAVGAELFYPDNRAFFEGLNVAGTDANGQFPPGTGELQIDMDPVTSDIAPIWNPEAFFNTMVVNGVTWPQLEVAPALYRFRLLNGSNSRFLNLAMMQVDGQGRTIRELPFYQIGTEQSLMPQVVRVETGYATVLPGDGSDVDFKYPTCTRKNGKPVKSCVPAAAASDPMQALLMGLAERADVIVDFRGRDNGDIIIMTNTAPDAPFGGFPDVPADPSTTGQVMQFVVNTALLGQSPTDATATPPANLAFGLIDGNAVTLTNSTPRELALVEEESALICADADLLGNVVQLVDHLPVAGACEGFVIDPTTGLPVTDGTVHPTALPFAPKAAVLGTVDAAGEHTVTLWSDPVVTNVNPLDDGNTGEQWNLWNFTVDGHPIHVHLVKFKVLGRTDLTGTPGTSVITTPTGVQPWENGWKDTVITFPGEITSIAADFDINGLYVWHCHILEHEDNEMMVPMCVGVAGVDCPKQVF